MLGRALALALAEPSLACPRACSRLNPPLLALRTAPRPAHPPPRSKIHSPRILLLDCPLEYKKGENQTNVELMKEEDW